MPVGRSRSIAGIFWIELPSMISTAPDQRYAAFRHSAFPQFLAARVMASFATQIVSVAVGWQIYDLTRDPFDLGLVGIVQFLPSLLLVLVTGTVADRFGRRMVMGLACGLEALCALGLMLLSWRGLSSPAPVFALLAVFGIARAFFGPASSSLIANLVPKEDFANAVAWNSSTWQVAAITGPVAGGLLYGLSAELAYGTAAALMALATLLLFSIPKPAQRSSTDRPTLDTLFAGFRYIWGNKVVLGAVSLDLFAVLLSGAVALLPVYARDILELGPWGLGLLRAAPGVGAIVVAVWLTGHPIRDHAGVVMFIFVGLFGAVTLVFGVSTVPWLSIAALALLGATDMVSVYIRETLIQVWTPDDVRGRVNAVNMVFVGASNEVGEFRAGIMASLIGTVPAVVFGGAGAVAVAGLWAYLFPELRKIRYLDGQR
jgi:MFS family permease